MKDTSHCKVNFRGDDGAQELAAFYNISATTSSDGTGTTLALGKEGAKLRISNTGELVLRDGTKIGHRSMRKYYKQNFSRYKNTIEFLFHFPFFFFFFFPSWMGEGGPGGGKGGGGGGGCAAFARVSNISRAHTHPGSQRRPPPPTLPPQPHARTCCPGPP